MSSDTAESQQPKAADWKETGAVKIPLAKDFPPLRNDLILRAARSQPVPRVPVWLMRQAGRYLPEFRATRSQHEFFEVCRTPYLACEVTLQPMRRFNLDAAIIFSDILVVPQAMGLEVLMSEGKGPVFTKPLSEPADLDRLKLPVDVRKELGYVLDAITLTRHSLAGQAPLIGFAGAPWTLMAYMIEGGSSTTHAKSKRWLYAHPEASVRLLDALTDVLIDFLVAQAQAGAQLLQLFESHCGCLTPDLFQRYELPRLARIAAQVRERLGADAPPLIAFAKDGHFALEALAGPDCGFDVVCVDWSMSPSECRRRLKAAGCSGTALQGNLDPVLMSCRDPDLLAAEVGRMLEGFGPSGYICNLGHGIYPDADPDTVARFVDEVHKQSEALIALAAGGDAAGK